MSAVVQVEIVIPEGMGKAEALAKVCACLQSLIASRCRFWRTGRGNVAVFALIVKETCVAISYQALHSVAGKSIPGRTPKYAGVHSSSSSSQGSA